MENVNFRLPEGEIEALKDEAEEKGYQTLSPYLRKIVSERDTNEHAGDRLDELEQRVRVLERETLGDERGQRDTSEYKLPEPNTNDYGAHGESESDDGIRFTLDQILGAVEDIDVEGKNERTREKRRDAIRTVLERLADEPGRASDLKEQYENAPAEYKDETSWWSNLIHPALQNLRERNFVRYHDSGERRFEYELVR